MGTNSNSLEITEISTPFGGTIGISRCPGMIPAKGKSRENAATDPATLLRTDLDKIAGWNAAAVVSIANKEELDHFGIGELRTEVERRFMESHGLSQRFKPNAMKPIFVGWAKRSAAIRQLLSCGQKVLIHGLSSFSRADVVAARILVEMGSPKRDAVELVRSAIPNAVQGTGGLRWIGEGRSQPLKPRVDDASRHDRAVGAFLGLAVGDAVGTTLEFRPKPIEPVLTDMIGGGPFHLQAGQWTDDTAMACALATSLLDCPEFDPTDLIERFLDWYRNGAYSCTHTCFDIGNATREALERFERTGDPFAGSIDPAKAGNGALMRLSPVSIRFWDDPIALFETARTQTQTTHASPACVEASMILADMLADAIAGKPLHEILASKTARRIQGGCQVHRDHITGLGYVVESLQAAVWAVARTTDFRSAVLMVANLGNDADTTAAIAGQLAGAIYGASQIPSGWSQKLARADKLREMASELFRM